VPADSTFGFGFAGGGAPDPNDPQQLQQFITQLQQMFTTPGGGPVNWDLARQVAHAHLVGGRGDLGAFGFGLPGGLIPGMPGSSGTGMPEMPGMPVPTTPAAGATDDAEDKPVGDPPVDPAERAAVVEALRLADLWLEPESALPSGLTVPAAWTRGEWLTATMDVWKKLCDPVAARIVGAMSDLVPEEMRGQLGPMAAMVSSLGGALFGTQLGTALGSLAAEVLSASDIGLPLAPPGTAALVPANIAGYGEGLELPADQVRLYVALRETAHQRLFSHVPWLRGHMLTAVEAYAAGIRVNREAVEEAIGRFDPMSPEGIQEIALDGIFAPDDSPQQQAALARLETALALVEGWVSHVVDQAAGERLPAVAQLSEAFRRRRGAGGPAEQTFAALVGLELRPRKLREAAALWAALTEHRGVAGRDALWGHPDLMPDAEAFADPQAFAESQLDLGDLGFEESGNAGGEDRPGGEPGGE
jgi:putative hydrolase